MIEIFFGLPGVFYAESKEIVLAIFIIFASASLGSLYLTFRGRRFNIRKLPAITAIDEALGRAAETGRPVMYLTGMYDMNSIPTMASIGILSYVAQSAAIYETKLIVPCCHSLVFNAARSAVYEAAVSAGRPDRYDADAVRYYTDEQWGFASAVDGAIIRENPAACLMFGHFASESLIYAETGHAVGAIQIAATNDFNQIPFFVIACDYCLIGEELYAAAAYLSKNQRDAGALFGLDICRVVVIVMILFGVIAKTVVALAP